MTKYINIPKEDRERARKIDVATFLLSQGEKIKKSGTEYVWMDGSGKVTLRNNLWYHHYQQEGGDIIDFVQKYYNKTYVEAVAFLLNQSYENLPELQKSEKEYKSFQLPNRSSQIDRLLSYLLYNRAIDKDVLYTFLRNGMIYLSAPHQNVVFVGYDLHRQPRHAHMRSTGIKSSYKKNIMGSQAEYSFHWYGKGNEIYLFEAPIDMLSFISMHKENWKDKNYAASCSVSDRVLFQCLKDNPNIKKVYLCFDNDEAGRIANKRIAEKLKIKHIEYEILVPKFKDWNEDLLNQERTGAICQDLKS